jgi:hypothetical protein
MPTRGQKERHAELGHGARGSPWAVADQDPALARGLDVDVLEAGAITATSGRLGSCSSRARSKRVRAAMVTTTSAGLSQPTSSAWSAGGRS